MAERQILQNAIGIGFIELLRRAEAATAFGAFTLEQMAFARARAHDFSGAGNFKTFCHRFSGFYPFGSSHKFRLSLKKSAQYRERVLRKQGVISLLRKEKPQRHGGTEREEKINSLTRFLCVSVPPWLKILRAFQLRNNFEV